jgi:phosphate-selective porin OprO and OprP
VDRNRFFKVFLLASASAIIISQTGAARASDEAHERLSRLEGLAGVASEPAHEPVHETGGAGSHDSKPKARKKKGVEHADGAASGHHGGAAAGGHHGGAAAGGHHGAAPASGHHGKAAASPELSALRSIEERLSRLEAAEAKAAHDSPKAAAGHAGGEHAKGAGAHGHADAKVEFNYLRPSFSSADGKNTLSIRALVQADVAAFDQDPSDMGSATTADHRDLGSGAVFRRVRFGVEGKFMEDFIYEMRFEFGGADTEVGGNSANNNSVIDIMRVGYTGIPNTRIHLGAIQPIMTMADATSSGELLFLERPSVVNVVTSAFGGKSGRRGVEATFQKAGALYDGDNLMLSGALTGSTVGTGHGGTSVDDEGVNVLGRAAYRFYSDENTNMQIGATAADVLSVAGVGTPGNSRYLKFRDRPEEGVSNEYLVEASTSGTSGIRSDGASLFGLEAGMNLHNFFLAGEWYEFDVDRDASVYDPNFSGWYVEGSWILTGEQRRYAASGTGNSIAVWDGPKVKKPFGSDGIGALELMGRYSVVDLNWNEGDAGDPTPTGGIRGGEQSIVSLGLIWYLNNNLRIMTDYQWVDVDRMDAAGDEMGQELDILQGRVQFKF